jgi:hypothetical protein
MKPFSLLLLFVMHLGAAQYGGVVFEKPANWTESQSGGGLQFSVPVPDAKERASLTLLPSIPVSGDFQTTFTQAIQGRLRPGERVVAGGEPQGAKFGRVTGVARGVVIETAARRQVYRLYIAFDLRDRLEWLEGEAQQQSDWARLTATLNSFVGSFKFVAGAPAAVRSPNQRRP